MARRVKVAEVVESTTTGVRRHLYDLVTHLDRNRFDVTVFCSTLRDPGFLQDIEAFRKIGVAVEPVCMRRRISPLSDTAALLRLCRAFKEGGFDIAHSHSSKGGVLGRLAADFARVPVVIHTPHVFPFEMRVSPLARRFYRAIERRLAGGTHRIICVSNWEKQAALRAQLVQEGRLIVIPNGIDAAVITTECPPDSTIRKELGLSDDELVVGAVGRPTKQKGYDQLLHIVPDILRDIHRARFVFVGDGELRPGLESLAARLGIRSRVIFAGSREDIRSLYPVFDVLAMPSLWESLPYSLLEAMTARRPVVAYAVGGIPEVLTSGQNGLLAGINDKHELARCIVHLLRNPAVRQALGARARDTVLQRYSLHTMIQSTERLYEAALDASTGKE